MVAFLFGSTTNPVLRRRLAWFPGELLQRGSPFRARMLHILSRDPVNYTPQTPHFTVSPEQAVAWLNVLMDPDIGCSEYKWLLTTILRVNFADALAQCPSSVYTTAMTHQFQLFIDSHLPLISTYTTMVSGEHGAEKMVAAAYGDTNAQNPLCADLRDPGRDDVLLMMYTHVKALAFYDPSCSEFGCAVLDKLKPMCSQTESIETFPDISQVLQQSSLTRNNRACLPLEHLFSKVTYNFKCLSRSFGVIEKQHCQRSPLICSFIRRMVYIMLSGQHSHASVRPNFNFRLALYSELIAPDDHTANSNFLTRWWTLFETIIYAAQSEFAAISLLSHTAMHKVFENDPIRKNLDAMSIAAMDMIRFHTSKFPSLDILFQAEMVRRNVTIRHMVTSQTYRPFLKEVVKPEGDAVARELYQLLLLGEREKQYIYASGGEMPPWISDHELCADTDINTLPDLCAVRDCLCMHAESVMWTDAKREFDKKLDKAMDTIAKQYALVRDNNQNWVKKLKKNHCLSLLHSECTKVYETFRWLLYSAGNAFVYEYPSDWKRQARRIDEFFDRTPAWKKRSTYRWINLYTELDISHATVQDLLACENFYHTPKPESKIFLLFVGILQRSFAEFLMVHRFLAKLDEQLQYTMYDTSVEVVMAQTLALRIQHGIMDSAAQPLPPEAGMVYFCPSCRCVRTEVAGSLHFSINHGQVGIEKASFDHVSGKLYCGKKNDIVYPRKKGMTNITELKTFLSKNFHTERKRCVDTELLAINAIGKIFIYDDKQYMLCMRCGTLALFDICLISGDMFLCGFCEDMCQHLAFANKTVYHMVAAPHIAANEKYDAISTDVEVYLNPKHWPAGFTQDAKHDTLEDLYELGLPCIAKQKKEIVCAKKLQGELAEDLRDTRCIACYDSRFLSVPLNEWAQSKQPETDFVQPVNENNQNTGANADNTRYHVFDNLTPGKENRRIRIVHLCKKHRFVAYNRIFGNSRIVMMTHFVFRYRNEYAAHMYNKVGSTVGIHTTLNFEGHKKIVYRPNKAHK